MNEQPDQPTDRLLVVDDNPAIHDDFRKIFNAHPQSELLAAAEAALFGDAPVTAEPSRFTIDSAFQGQEGLARVEESLAEGRPYPMAFVDVRMPPGWDGIETIEQLWKVDPDLQVVICTAYSDYSWDEMIGKLGTTDRLVILKKPFDNVEVLQLAHALTVKWKLAREVRRQINGLETLVAARTARLEQSEAQFRIIAENVGDLIAVLDARGANVYLNPAYQRVLGRRVEELGVKPPVEHIHPDDQVKVLVATHRALETGIAQVLEYRLRHRHGDWRTVEAQFNPVRNAAGAIEHLVMVARDLTQRRQLEAEIRQSQKMEAMAQLAASLAPGTGDDLSFFQPGLRDLTTLLTAQARLLAAAKEGRVSPELVAQVEAAAAAAEVDFLIEEIPRVLEQAF